MHPSRSILLRASWVLCARRDHGGTKQVRMELQRQVLLEQAMERPASRQDREQALASSRAQTAAYLRSLDDRVTEARRLALGSDTSLPSADAALTSSSSAHHKDAQPVVSLSQFLMECRRLRTDFGLEKRRHEREKLRQRFRNFWEQHANSAVACCEVRGRDFGFVAEHGLSDDRLHISLEAMQVGLRALTVDREVSSCRDTMASLHFLARELASLEAGSPKQNTNRNKAASTDDSNGTVPAAALFEFRRLLTNVALERIAFFFIIHAPDASGNPLTERTEGQAVLGNAADAINGLEVLSRVSIQHADREVVQSLINAIQQLPPSSSQYLDLCGSTREASNPTAVTSITQAYFVTQVFTFVCAQRRTMNFTSLVQSFALLRIFLPELWPPYRHADRTGTGPPTAAAAAAGKAPSQPDGVARRNLYREKDALMRITWSLATTLRHKDSSFVNPYHFVKIVGTLSKLPAFTLSPSVHKTELKSLEFRPASKDARSEKAHGDEGDVTHHEKKPVVMRPEDFWRLVVSKACVFVPSLPIPQRRVVCRGLHMSIAVKRGHLLNGGMPSAMDTKTVPQQLHTGESGVYALVPVGDSADDILLPLVEEMESLAEGFNASVAAAGGRSMNEGSGGSRQGREGQKHKYNKDGSNGPREHKQRGNTWSNRRKPTYN